MGVSRTRHHMGAVCSLLCWENLRTFKERYTMGLTETHVVRNVYQDATLSFDVFVGILYAYDNLSMSIVCFNVSSYPRSFQIEYYFLRTFCTRAT